MIQFFEIGKNKITLLEQRNNKPTKSITALKPSFRGIITTYIKDQVQKFGTVFVTGSNVTCTPISI